MRSLLQTGKIPARRKPGYRKPVADKGATSLGCVYVELRGERAYLGLLSVDPKQQKSGLGSALMNAAEEYCAKEGCRFMDLRIVNLRRGVANFLPQSRIRGNRNRAPHSRPAAEAALPLRRDVKAAAGKKD